jgi:hypothetical protein
MSIITRHLLIALAGLTIASSALATPQIKSANPGQLAKSAAGPSKPAAPTTLAASGKIVKFDPADQSLTLSTAKGDEQFTIAAATRLRSASRTIAANDLASLAGHQATVRYHESSGQKTVLSVRVSPAAPKTAAKH